MLTSETCPICKKNARPVGYRACHECVPKALESIADCVCFVQTFADDIQNGFTEKAPALRQIAFQFQFDGRLCIAYTDGKIFCRASLRKETPWRDITPEHPLPTQPQSPPILVTKLIQFLAQLEEMDQTSAALVAIRDVYSKLAAILKSCVGDE
jgi:hypothetical protein